jgi:hypothetical protein
MIHIHFLLNSLYLRENEYVSYSSFFAIKPFYIRTPTERDMEMCVCKSHLHARYAIASLSKCATEQNIELQSWT